MAIDIARIRNVGFVGHGGVGKTSLVEAILFRNGMTSRLGRVDDGTTTTDFDPDEIKRKISINIAVALLRLPAPPVQPRRHAGIRRLHRRRAGRPPRGRGRRWWWWTRWPASQVQTEKVWKFAKEYGLPRAGRSSTGSTASGPTSTARSSRSSAGSRGGSCRSTCRSARRPGSAGSWIVLRMKGYVLGDGRARSRRPTSRPSSPRPSRSAREKLVEAAAETDDDLLAQVSRGGLARPRPRCIKALRAAIGDGQAGARDPGAAATQAIGVRRCST